MKNSVEMASNAFGFDVYRRLGNAANLSFSPFSLSAALTLTWRGARGETAREMARVLHLENDAKDAARVAELCSALARSEESLTLHVAHRLFGARRFSFERAFIEDMERSFGSAFESLDFESNPESARGQINRWVETQTRRRIRELLPEGCLAPTTTLVLVNALYFLGSWLQPFDAEDTADAPFHLASGATVSVSTMHLTDRFDVARLDGATALAMPYAESEFFMLVLLPDMREATAVMAVRGGLPPKPEPPIPFNADHPFWFAILQRTTGLVLFMGRVGDPSQR